MSITKAQADAISSGFLQSLGTNRPAVAGAVVEEVLQQAIAAFAGEVVKNLDEAGAVATGELAGIKFLIEKRGMGYYAAVGYEKGSKAAGYYDYVNKGVASLSGGGAPGSPYKFRTPFISKKMAAAILSWYRQQGKGATNVKEPKTGKLGILERKRKTLSDRAKATDSLKLLAYATSSAIKKRGLRPTHYFDNAVNTELGEQFRQALAVAFGAEVILDIRRTML